MIVVRVELHSAITGKTTEIARALIYNDGGTREEGEYQCFTLPGEGSAEPWTRKQVVEAMKSPLREGRVAGYPRLTAPVWDLVTLALKSMGYGGKGENRD